jgi:RNA polymerase sigma-70 factor, ECF subfamily
VIRPFNVEIADLYARHAAGLYAYARAILGDPGRAEDAVQEAFARLLEQGVDRISSVAAFLYAVVRNGAIDEKRRASTRARSLPYFAVATPDPAERELRERASAGLAALPEEQREVLVLKLYSGKTFAEIADLTGTSLDTAHSRYRYGLEKLGRLLEGIEGRTT